MTTPYSGINDRLIGATLPLTFFKVDMNPGSQHLNGLGLDNGVLELETRPGGLISSGFRSFPDIPASRRLRSSNPGWKCPIAAVCCKTGAQASTPCFDSRIPR